MPKGLRVQVPPGAPNIMECVMKKLAIIVLFAVCTIYMGHFILNTVVGDFQTHSKLASATIYTALMLFSYKLVYFCFDLVYHCCIELRE